MENLRALIENHKADINNQHPATEEEKELFRIKYQQELYSLMELRNKAIQFLQYLNLLNKLKYLSLFQIF